MNKTKINHLIGWCSTLFMISGPGKRFTQLLDIYKWCTNERNQTQLFTVFTRVEISAKRKTNQDVTNNPRLATMMTIFQRPSGWSVTAIWRMRCGQIRWKLNLRHKLRLKVWWRQNASLQENISSPAITHGDEVIIRHLDCTNRLKFFTNWSASSSVSMGNVCLHI